MGLEEHVGAGHLFGDTTGNLLEAERLADEAAAMEPRNLRLETLRLLSGTNYSQGASWWTARPTSWPLPPT